MTKPEPKPSSSPRSDIDLMAYADGELEGADRAHVEAWLAEDASARAKLEGLRQVSQIVRRAPFAEAPGDGLTASIMKAVATSAKPGSPNPAAPRKRSPLVYIAPALAIAAAAALVVALDPYDFSSTTTAQAARPAPAPGTAVAVVGSAAGAEHGVEVWSVDFGRSSGAVFYVPSEASTDTTTVVWLSDTGGGEEDE